MRRPLHVPLADGHYEVSFLHAAELQHTRSFPPEPNYPDRGSYFGQRIRFHGGDYHGSVPTDGKPEPLGRPSPVQLHGPRGGPVLLRREDGDRSQRFEEVVHAVLGEVGGCQGQLELGGG